MKAIRRMWVSVALAMGMLSVFAGVAEARLATNHNETIR